MDDTRALYGNGEPYRGKPAITYRHYNVSPDPADKIDLARLRELTVTWAKKHFGEYQVAVVYRDDNENRIPHAHVVVNNTNVETGKRLHVPNPKELNRDLQEMARERGLGYLADRPSVFNRRARGGEARTGQREFKGRAERRIEREGGYSWVADIRECVKTARALACDEEGFRSLLGALGVEVSLNSPNAAGATTCSFLRASLSSCPCTGARRRRCWRRSRPSPRSGRPRGTAWSPWRPRAPCTANTSR